MKKDRKERLDKLLVELGLVETRSKAQSLILAGQIFSKQQRLDKPGMMIPWTTEISIKEKNPFVSRGGIKLKAALEHFAINVQGFVCLDIGASTGGFTDCLLQNGARKVIALDVGHGQLAWRIRQDSRVEVREHINARFLKQEDFQENFDLVVCDVAFISLKLILPVIPPLLKNKGQVITLIKPQFEVGRDEVGRGGIVQNEVAQKRVVSEIKDFATSLGLVPREAINSPIEGQDGNREFLTAYDFVSKNN